MTAQFLWLSLSDMKDILFISLLIHANTLFLPPTLISRECPYALFLTPGHPTPIRQQVTALPFTFGPNLLALTFTTQNVLLQSTHPLTLYLLIVVLLPSIFIVPCPAVPPPRGFIETCPIINVQC